MTKLTADIEKNFELFVQQTKETGKVWSLRNKEEDWLACDSAEFENSEVMPFWSSQQDAAIHNVEEWAEFDVCEIPLDLFVQEWLTTLTEDEVLVGVNWNAELEGLELEPAELAKQYL